MEKNFNHGKKASRISSAALALLLLSSIIATSACGNNPTNTPDNTSDATDSQNDTVDTQPIEITRDNAEDSLPDLNFEGQEIRILTRAGDNDTYQEFNAESENGDIINDAVYKRNSKIQDRLNVKMTVINTTKTRHAENTAQIRTSVLAQSDDFDLVSDHMTWTMSSVLEGLYMDMSKLDYLDFSKPWWNQSYMELSAIDGKIFAAAGELSLTMISGAYAMFFNSDLFAEIYDDVNLYEVVEDGKWTFDALNKYASGLYKDLNGNTKADEDDFYGFYIQDTLAGDGFFGGIMPRIIEDTGNGYKFSMLNDRTVKFAEQLKKLIYDESVTFRGGYNEAKLMKPLYAGTALFTHWMLGGVDYLRDMEANYGILPMPKLDESQSEYTGYTHDGFSIFAIPKTCQIPDCAAAFLEAMNAESYRSVVPAYFETALKVKYSRDDLTARMLDIIVDNIYLDVSYVYGIDLGTWMQMIRDMINDSKYCDNFASTVAEREAALNASLTEIMTKYNELS
ncbi:MAG: hypothetical protein HFE63_02575 [Clostridiales bacterium]|nr:hypothetical protein [Clostridiales bacterium]